MKERDYLIFCGSFLGATGIGILLYKRAISKKKIKEVKEAKENKYIEFRKNSLKKSLDFINNYESVFVEVFGPKKDYPARDIYNKQLKEGQIIPAKIIYDNEKNIYIVKVKVNDAWTNCGFIQNEIYDKNNKSSSEIYELLSYYRRVFGNLPDLEINLVGKEHKHLKAEIKILKEEIDETSKLVKEIKEDINKTSIDINPERLDKKELVFSAFFNTDIKKEYEEPILKFLDSNDSSILKYVVKFVFDENGEFNYDVLKKLFEERYINIKNIMKAEVFDMPALFVFPLERYLSEIDTLSTSNANDKVEGMLSYWITIAESISIKDIV